MAMVSSISLPFPPKVIDSKRRDASFSSFLNAAEENFIPNHLVIKEKDGEIGVFGAEKYFNGGMDDEPPLPTSISARKLRSQKMAEKVDIDSMAKPKSQPGTPSVRSEASWNSQSALLRSVLKIPGKSKRNRGKGFLSRCKCSCCYKTSVDVMEDFGDLKAPNPGESRRDERKEILDDFKINESRSWFKKEEIGETFTFPISKPESGNFPSNMQNAEVKEEEKKPIKSLEIFRNRSLSFPRSKTKIWEGNLQEEELQSSADNGGLYDTSSDCSSDLFEIESLTGKSIHCLRRQNSDSTSCFTQTTCYAPSEVSIEWSVVTASAADFSAASDNDSDQKPAGAKSGNPVQKRRSGILLGCTNQKAVGVASDAYRKAEKVGTEGSGRRRSECVPPLASFEAETKQTSLSSKQKNQALPSLSHPRPLQTQVANVLEKSAIIHV